jgi:DNA polymerase-3 subunit epsilon
MRPGTRFAAWLALLIAGVLGWIALSGWLLWRDLDEPERTALGALIAPREPLLVLAAAGLAVMLGALLRAWFAAYPQAARRMADEVRDLHAVDAERRVEPRGGPEMQQLAAAMNAFAVVHRTLKTSIGARVDESNARLEQEKQRLAALMSQLAQSVIVCNDEGRILLYNARATELLAARDEDGAPVGLGRSVFGVLDKRLVVHGLDRIRDQIAHGQAEPAAQFVAERAGRMLRGQMAPVRDASQSLVGFVLVLSDVTRAIESGTRRDLLLQQLTEHTRASLANIRAAAETMHRFPAMEPERRERFVEVVRAESERLSRTLDDTLARHPDAQRAQWPLEDMLAADFLAALKRSLEHTAGVRVERADAAPGL